MSVSVHGCIPTLLHEPGCNRGEWVDLQLVHGFRFYDNMVPHILAIGAHDSVAVNTNCQRVHACTCSMPGFICRQKEVRENSCTAHRSIGELDVCISVCVLDLHLPSVL